MQRLIKHNHRPRDIESYTIEQFLTYLDAAERADAVSRLAFTMDVTAAIAGAFSQSGDTLNEHLNSLQSIAKGE